MFVGIATGFLAGGAFGYMVDGWSGAAFGTAIGSALGAMYYGSGSSSDDRQYTKRLNVKWEVSDWLPTFAVFGLGQLYIVFYALEESMDGDAYHVLTRALRPFVTRAGEYIPTLQLHKQGLILHGYAGRVDFVSHVYVFSWVFAVLAGVTTAIFCVRRFDAIVELAHRLVDEKQYFRVAMLIVGFWFIVSCMLLVFAFEPQINFQGAWGWAVSRIHVSNLYAIREFFMVVGGAAMTVWTFVLFIAFLRVFFVSLSRPKTRE